MQAFRPEVASKRRRHMARGQREMAEAQQSRRARLFICAVLLAGPFISSDEPKAATIEELTTLIMNGCMAAGSQSLEVSKSGDAVEVQGPNGSFLLQQRATGIIGGLSDKITSLQAQQASEARRCTEKYLGEILDYILHSGSGTSNYLA
jgi:hypothetical protein